MNEVKILKPWQFLVLVFRHLAKTKPDYVSFAELTRYADYLKRVYSVEVDWDHDSYNYTFGFYSPIFQEVHNGASTRAVGAKCDWYKLKTLGQYALDNGRWVPKRRAIVFKNKEIYDENSKG